MKKKVLSLLLAVVLVCSLCVPAFAAEKGKSDSNVHVMLVNTDVANATLVFSGNCANCSGFVFGKTGTNKITATVYLKRVNDNGTTTVKAWTGLSASGDQFIFDRSYYVASGYTYELEINAKVYRNGTCESISISDDEYCG